MGRKYQYATSAELCERKGREACDDRAAAEWFALADYWLILSRGVSPEDSEDQFIAKLDSVGTGQMASDACH